MRKKYNAEFEFIVLQLSIEGVSDEKATSVRILITMGMVSHVEKG